MGNAVHSIGAEKDRITEVGHELIGPSRNALKVNRCFDLERVLWLRPVWRTLDFSQGTTSGWSKCKTMPIRRATQPSSTDAPVAAVGPPSLTFSMYAAMRMGKGRNGSTRLSVAHTIQDRNVPIFWLRVRFGSFCSGLAHDRK